MKRLLERGTESHCSFVSTSTLSASDRRTHPARATGSTSTLSASDRRTHLLQWDPQSRPYPSAAAAPRPVLYILHAANHRLVLRAAPQKRKDRSSSGIGLPGFFSRTTWSNQSSRQISSMPLFSSTKYDALPGKMNLDARHPHARNSRSEAPGPARRRPDPTRKRSDPTRRRSGPTRKNPDPTRKLHLERPRHVVRCGT